MLQLQFLYLQTLNPKLCPLQSLSNSKPNPFSSISSTKNFLNIKKKKFLVKCRQSEYYEQKSFLTPPSNSSFASQNSTEAAVGPLPPRVYVGHSIYKGKAAVTVEPRAPEFVSLDSGAFKLSKEGFVLLQFAPAVGVRQYDWSRKQVFSLSVTEIGTLVGLGSRESCEFFHDPFKGRSEEGKVRKVLKVEPLPDGSGHFFNLNVQSKLINLDESIYIPITRAEYTVLISAFNYILPYLLGWHAYANSIKPDDTSRANSANPRYGGDFEWNR
ncbi:single-stranded DNA-binding protein WHY1, chloroplastic-like [Mangifera indica]|uniref:single-stranded DNA-binding protein WHY1, chloroplastic-like n=1 Tax=Mangifera indica TaxID=29780 RepID=UPI001CFBFE35|nr:single-stranded DNA-binding protein WHY1, chloroplastic-like [Mangifera indica]